MPTLDKRQSRPELSFVGKNKKGVKMKMMFLLCMAITVGFFLSSCADQGTTTAHTTTTTTTAGTSPGLSGGGVGGGGGGNYPIKALP